MPLSILNDSRQQRGGGFSFTRNLLKALEGCEFSQELFLIPSASMVLRNTVEEARLKGKLILRVDNWLKDSRNKGSGMSRMIDFAGLVDMVVYQSEWARRELSPYLSSRVKSTVILNGSDPEIFSTSGMKRSIGDEYKWLLFVQQNDDLSKQFHMALDVFRRRQLRFHRLGLCLLGNYSKESVKWNFDLGDRSVANLGSIRHEDVAVVMRSCSGLLYSYYNDSCPNVLNEALLCGLDIIDCAGMLQTGGAPEVMFAGGRTLQQMGAEYKEVFESL